MHKKIQSIDEYIYIIYKLIFLFASIFIHICDSIDQLIIFFVHIFLPTFLPLFLSQHYIGLKDFRFLMQIRGLLFKCAMGTTCGLLIN